MVRNIKIYHTLYVQIYIHLKHVAVIVFVTKADRVLCAIRHEGGGNVEDPNVLVPRYVQRREKSYHPNMPIDYDR